MENVSLPKLRLDDQVALITGAAQGLGRWIALGMSLAGADVLIVDVNRKGAERTAEEIRELGGKAIALVADVTRIDSIEVMAKEALQAVGRIDCLVNNAGVNVHKPFLEVGPDDFDFVTSVNLKGTYFTSQVIGKKMISQGWGRIINVASAAGFLVRPGISNSVYATTKAGIIMLTKALAEELSSHKINVNAIAPGYFATPMVQDRLEERSTLDSIISFTPLKRIGQFSDIIGPIVFLASDSASFVTGQTIFVDGGRSIL